MEFSRTSRPVLALVAVALVGCSTHQSSSGLPVGGHGPRPADACTMLTSDQVAAIVGTPGPFTGAHEDPAEDGTPVWGCTWGTHRSYADVRELSAARFERVSTPDPDTVLTPLRGIGDKALLRKNRSDGGNSSVYFATAGRYYETQVTVDRHAYRDGPNAGREARAAQNLAKTLVPRLSH
ncbi:MAG: hypothetical protein ACJ73S_05335 [Mycobacteriales bacterium]